MSFTPANQPFEKVKPAENQAPKDSTIDRDYLMGKVNPGQDTRFAKIEPTYSNGEAMYMRKEAYEAFIKMFNAAKKEGVILKIISATRPFEHQKGIWEAKWTGKKAVDGAFLKGTPTSFAERALKIMRWSSMPGTSRHHWGTDIDLNDLNNSYFEKSVGKKVYEWLSAHASEYGFCQVYSPKGEKRPHGYEEEKWHWSYTPLAADFTKQYAQLIKNEDIQGFIGSESAVEIKAVERFVLGINHQCE